MKHVLLGAAFVPFFAWAASADVVTVFAAASLKGPLDEVAADFTVATGHEVAISYAGSNALAKQILDGAPADVFISASSDWMDKVEAGGVLAPASRQDLLGNTLVLVGQGAAAPVAISKDLDLKGLIGEQHLALAMVDSVPAGQYGKAALEHLGLWAGIEASVAQSENVRATLALVGRGEAPYGIVYKTDAAADKDVTIVGTFPEDSHPPITYPAAVVGATPSVAVTAFYDALSGDAADAIFAKAGFEVK